MKLPTSSSTPNQVRDYIVRLLVTKHEVANGNAIEIAKKWQTHRGTSLRTATSKYLSDVFGSEIGPMIHSDVQLDLEYEAKWTDPFSGNLNLVLIAASFSWGVHVLLQAGQKPTSPEMMTSLAVGSLFAGPVALTLVLSRPRGDRLKDAIGLMPVFLSVIAMFVWAFYIVVTMRDSEIFAKRARG